MLGYRSGRTAPGRPFCAARFLDLAGLRQEKLHPSPFPHGLYGRVFPSLESLNDDFVMAITSAEAIVRYSGRMTVRHDIYFDVVNALRKRPRREGGGLSIADLVTVTGLEQHLVVSALSTLVAQHRIDAFAVDGTLPTRWLYYLCKDLRRPCSQKAP